MPRALVSSTRNRVPGFARSTVYGCPSSLLNEPGGAMVGPAVASTCASRSFVEVLPDEPVTPMTVASGSLRATAPANAASASTPSSTRIAAASTGRVTMLATAPAALAVVT